MYVHSARIGLFRLTLTLDVFKFIETEQEIRLIKRLTLTLDVFKLYSTL